MNHCNVGDVNRLVDFSQTLPAHQQDADDRASLRLACN